ncbi:chemotaxis protein CheW [Azospirillum sp. YIM B02556]|uniref:Chemotaxis protein CheW n=1 Tax=Azospirillum endophyticum TaxID=2800326 RepID=A0ABS1F3X9_9PROT|nr:chemotaxis protein CheW [Azospirillum endophyticum]MBK1838124.1 chemotaxis protein CheW [Azospirillum endophyticum]
MATGQAVGEADAGLAFVTVAVGDLRLALPLSAVRAVIRPPDLVRIPLGPPSLDGLAQWHGEAVPVLDLCKSLGARSPEGGASGGREARVVVVGHRGQPVGLRVDAMAGILRCDPDRIEPVTQEEGGLDPAMLDGLLLDGPATILKLDALIDRQFGDMVEAEPGRTDRGMAGLGLATAAAAGGAGELDRRALLVFEVAGQEFALPVDRVREVLPAPREVARMARAKAHLLGVMSVRDRLLPLVGLRALFGLDGAGGQAAGRRVVVVRSGDAQAPVGVLVDEVREILRLDPALIDPVPPLLAREPEFEDLDGIARADGGDGRGRRLVSVLSAERLFRHGAALASDLGRKVAGREGDGMDPVSPADGGRGGSGGRGIGERFVVFHLAGAEYGLPVAAVREVLRRPDSVTPLPGAPDFVAGVLTLRSEVLPLIDQRRLLNLPAAQPATGQSATGESVTGPAAGLDRGRVVVVGRDGFLVGLLVDGLSGLLTVPPERIGPAPVVSAAQRRLIRRVATLESGSGARLILLMDADSLLDMDRLADLLVAPP